MTEHQERLDAIETLTDAAAEEGDLPLGYHERTVLEFLLYTMQPDIRRRLMTNHPVSYRRVLESRTY